MQLPVWCKDIVENFLPCLICQQKQGIKSKFIEASAPSLELMSFLLTCDYQQWSSSSLRMQLCRRTLPLLLLCRCIMSESLRTNHKATNHQTTSENTFCHILSVYYKCCYFTKTFFVVPSLYLIILRPLPVLLLATPSAVHIPTTVLPPSAFPSLRLTGSMPVAMAALR